MFDLALVGGGFGGALLAQIARRLGRSVLLIERGAHPRFAIGESTSPLMNLLIEEIARRYRLPRLLPLATWGAWKRAYPELGVGQKRGFTYFGHQPGQAFSRCPDRSDQLAVAASPGEECADTHWLRADVDRFLFCEAAALGADCRERTTVIDVAAGHEGWSLVLERDGVREIVRARALIDATGPDGFLHRTFGFRDIGFDGYPATRALFSHFAGVKKVGEMAPFDSGGEPPYPPDWAALHHVFPGGWMWVLRFDHEITSAGIAVEDWLADELALEGREAAWSRFLTRFPSIGQQFADAVPVQPWIYQPRLPFRTQRAAGRAEEGGAPWLSLPSAAGFIDPLFSTGMPLTLLGILRVAHGLEAGTLADPAWLGDYERTTFEELDWTAEFVAAHYDAMGSFEHFAALTMYYFAAASFAEMARRLEKPDLSPRFLAGADPRFRAGIARCRAALSQRPLPEPDDFARRIADDIAHKNIAGLAAPEKRNWYGVDLDDVVRGAAALGFTPDRMRQILAEAEWAKC